MSEESSPLGVTTTSTYIDLGAVTPEAYAISEKSRKMACQALGNETPEDRIRQRCSIAVGDFAMAPLLRFQHDSVQALLAALARNAPIFTDIRMVNLGIQKKGHLCPIICALDYGQEMAATKVSPGLRPGSLPLKISSTARSSSSAMPRHRCCRSAVSWSLVSGRLLLLVRRSGS